MDVTGVGTSAVAEDEEEIVTSSTEEVEEISASEAFLEVWNMLGEQIVEDTNRDVLLDFLETASESQYVFGRITAFADEDDQEGYSLEAEFEFVDELDEEVLDDLEGCDCPGDSDESD